MNECNACNYSNLNEDYIEIYGLKFVENIEIRATRKRYNHYTGQEVAIKDNRATLIACPNCGNVTLSNASIWR